MSEEKKVKVVIDLSVDSDDDFEFIPRPIPPPRVIKRKFPINDMIPKRRVTESDNVLLSPSRDWSKVFEEEEVEREVEEEDSFILDLSEFESDGMFN